MLVSRTPAAAERTRIGGVRQGRMGEGLAEPFFTNLPSDVSNRLAPIAGDLRDVDINELVEDMGGDMMGGSSLYPDQNLGGGMHNYGAAAAAGGGGGGPAGRQRGAPGRRSLSQGDLDIGNLNAAGSAPGMPGSLPVSNYSSKASGGGRNLGMGMPGGGPGRGVGVGQRKRRRPQASASDGALRTATRLPQIPVVGHGGGGGGDRASPSGPLDGSFEDWEKRNGANIVALKAQINDENRRGREQERERKNLVTHVSRLEAANMSVHDDNARMKAQLRDHEAMESTSHKTLYQQKMVIESMRYEGERQE